ncbi:MAG TPA: hypothetical protein VFK05_07275 [Polyangiaceae bacterium]|nr:hypothetical protein [Polyangiaceae bacterium]
MPLVIGQLNAVVEIVRSAPRRDFPPKPEIVDEEERRARAVREQRLEDERRIDQRDPGRLGGG